MYCKPPVTTTTGSTTSPATKSTTPTTSANTYACVYTNPLLPVCV
jgi:hypothetical protein